MSRPLHIEVSDLAKAQIHAADEWWRVNRPQAGVCRLHLARIRYYVYYRVITQPEQVELLAFWHVSRGSAPPL